MLRKDAENLIGTHVSAWTSANGVYAGTLVEVTKNVPWRGKVRITGVLEMATPWEAGRGRQRRGFRPGEVIEVGGTNIRSTEEKGSSYLDVMKRLLANYRQWVADDPENKRNWSFYPSIKALEASIAAEEANPPSEKASPPETNPSPGKVSPQEINPKTGMPKLTRPPFTLG